MLLYDDTNCVKFGELFSDGGELLVHGMGLSHYSLHHTVYESTKLMQALLGELVESESRKKLSGRRDRKRRNKGKDEIGNGI